MLEFIHNFLCNRTFQVKTPNSLSDSFKQKIGVPQGSSILITLFLIVINDRINDISEAVRNPNMPLLYADDFTIICRSFNSITIQQLLQDLTNKLISWSKISSFRFALNKTSLILINQKKKKETISVNIGSHSIKKKT